MTTAASSEMRSSSSPSPPSPQQPAFTPKRKRDGIPPTPPTSSPELRLDTKVPFRPLATPLTDSNMGTESPRSKVAYDLQDMNLEDRAPVSVLNFQGASAPPADDAPGECPAPKRIKTLGDRRSAMLFKEREIPETPPTRNFKVAIEPHRGVDATVTETTEGSEPRNDLDPMIFKGSNVKKSKSDLSRSFQSINRLSDHKSSAPKKRMGTPPLLSSTEGALNAEIDEAERRVVDPDRAALTWHDDEITGHDPDDPDDDGEGINGIGFRPTPAMAYARSEKRRQQMAEYRNREAREARARRSERRRGPVSSKEEMAEASDDARHVRFRDGMVEEVITTD